MAISQLLHASLLATDLERSHRFYKDVLGLESVERPLTFPGLWYQIGAQQLHLIEVNQLKPDQVNREKWGRNRHLAFCTDTLSEIRVRLEAQNIQFQMSASGRAALFTKDPDGNIIEILEQPKAN